MKKLLILFLGFVSMCGYSQIYQTYNLEIIDMYTKLTSGTLVLTGITEDTSPDSVLTLKNDTVKKSAIFDMFNTQLPIIGTDTISSQSNPVDIAYITKLANPATITLTLNGNDRGVFSDDLFLWNRKIASTASFAEPLVSLTNSNNTSASTVLYMRSYNQSLNDIADAITQYTVCTPVSGNTTSGFGLKSKQVQGKAFSTNNVMFSQIGHRMKGTSISDFYTEYWINTNLDNAVDSTFKLTPTHAYFHDGLIDINETDTAITINGLNIKPGVVTIANDGIIAFQDGKSGFGEVYAFSSGSIDEWATFTFNADGTVELKSNSTNVSTTQGTASSLNIYDHGSNIAVENKLGGSRDVKFKINY